MMKDNDLLSVIKSLSKNTDNFSNYKNNFINSVNFFEAEHTGIKIPQEIIDHINLTKKIPEMLTLIIDSSENYKLCWKDELTQESFLEKYQTLPGHLELRNDFFGYTRVFSRDSNLRLIPHPCNN